MSTTIPEVLLDTTWTIQRIPSYARLRRDLTTLLHDFSQAALLPGRSRPTNEQLERLSQECANYVLARGRAEPHDELNDRSESSGSLRECVISALNAAKADTSKQFIGLLIELRYQKTIDQLVLLTTTNSDDQRYHIPLLLAKGAQAQIKKMKDWLDFRFDLPPAMSYQLQSDLLCHVCSRYLATGRRICSASDRAMQRNILKQMVGTIKITITFSSNDSPSISPNLKSLDLEVPPDTIEGLIMDTKTRSLSMASLEDGILAQLGTTIREKTGLILPLTGIAYLDENGEGHTKEPPLRISRLSCAAFAISTEGRLKLASKPIENAETTGYEPGALGTAYLELLEHLIADARKTDVGD